jgi:hypothetical protein
MRYIILSWDNEEEQTFYDIVQAETTEKARELVKKVRDNYAEIIASFDAEDLRSMADRIARAPEDEVISASNWKKFKEAS